MKKILILPLLIVVISAIFHDNAYATSYMLSDTNSCKTLGGTPNFVPNSCTFSANLVLNSDDILTISAGTSLIMEGTITNAGGTIMNYGVLDNFNTIDNIGFIANLGTITNSATINNYDTIWNSCSGIISGNMIRGNSLASQC